MVANDPQVTVLHVEELFTDHLGQRWSPATVRIVWAAHEGLRAPSTSVHVIAAVRGQMTAEALRAAHLSAARNVLEAAVRSLGEADGAGS
ncbi:MAG: hypothetical protein QOD74_1045 [Variibacter sp.]|nr:hypothetical protein [Variibacter sp.]